MAEHNPEVNKVYATRPTVPRAWSPDRENEHEAPHEAPTVIIIAEDNPLERPSIAEEAPELAKNHGSIKPPEEGAHFAASHKPAATNQEHLSSERRPSKTSTSSQRLGRPVSMEHLPRAEASHHAPLKQYASTGEVHEAGEEKKKKKNPFKKLKFWKKKHKSDVSLERSTDTSSPPPPHSPEVRSTSSHGSKTSDRRHLAPGDAPRVKKHPSDAGSVGSAKGSKRSPSPAGHAAETGSVGGSSARAAKRRAHKPAKAPSTTSGASGTRKTRPKTDPTLDDDERISLSASVHTAESRPKAGEKGARSKALKSGKVHPKTGETKIDVEHSEKTPLVAATDSQFRYRDEKSLRGWWARFNQPLPKRRRTGAIVFLALLGCFIVGALYSSTVNLYQSNQPGAMAEIAEKPNATSEGAQAGNTTKGGKEAKNPGAGGKNEKGNGKDQGGGGKPDQNQRGQDQGKEGDKGKNGRDEGRGGDQRGRDDGRGRGGGGRNEDAKFIEDQDVSNSTGTPEPGTGRERDNRKESEKESYWRWDSEKGDGRNDKGWGGRGRGGDDDREWKDKWGRKEDGKFIADEDTSNSTGTPEPEPGKGRDNRKESEQGPSKGRDSGKENGNRDRNGKGWDEERRKESDRGGRNDQWDRREDVKMIEDQDVSNATGKERDNRKESEQESNKRWGSEKEKGEGKPWDEGGKDRGDRKEGVSNSTGNPEPDMGTDRDNRKKPRDSDRGDDQGRGKGDKDYRYWKDKRGRWEDGKFIEDQDMSNSTGTPEPAAGKDRDNRKESEKGFNNRRDSDKEKGGDGKQWDEGGKGDQGDRKWKDKGDRWEDSKFIEDQTANSTEPTKGRDRDNRKQSEKGRDDEQRGDKDREWDGDDWKNKEKGDQGDSKGNETLLGNKDEQDEYRKWRNSWQNDDEEPLGYKKKRSGDHRKPGEFYARGESFKNETIIQTEKVEDNPQSNRGEEPPKGRPDNGRGYQRSRNLPGGGFKASEKVSSDSARFENRKPTENTTCGNCIGDKTDATNQDYGGRDRKAKDRDEERNQKYRNGKDDRRYGKGDDDGREPFAGFIRDQRVINENDTAANETEGKKQSEKGDDRQDEKGGWWENDKYWKGQEGHRKGQGWREPNDDRDKNRKEDRGDEREDVYFAKDERSQDDDGSRKRDKQKDQDSKPGNGKDDGGRNGKEPSKNGPPRKGKPGASPHKRGPLRPTPGKKECNESGSNCTQQASTSVNLTELQWSAIEHVSPAAIAVLAPIFGLLTQFAPRLFLLLGLFLVGGAYVGYGCISMLATGVAYLNVALILRVIQGVGTAAFLVAVFAMLALECSGNMAMVTSMATAALYAGFAAGPAIFYGFLQVSSEYDIGEWILGGIAVILSFVCCPCVNVINGQVAEKWLGKSPSMFSSVFLWFLATVSVVTGMSASFFACRLFRTVNEVSDLALYVSLVMVGFVLLLVIVMFVFGALMIVRASAAWTYVIIGLGLTTAGYLVAGPTPLFEIKAYMWSTGVAAGLIAIGSGLILSTLYSGMLDAANKVGRPDSLKLNAHVAGIFVGSTFLGVFLASIITEYAVPRLGWPWATTIIACINIFMVLVGSVYKAWKVFGRRKQNYDNEYSAGSKVPPLMSYGSMGSTGSPDRQHKQII